MKKIRVLSLDGGGIRGIIPAVILQYIESRLMKITNNPNARIADFFDLIAGTSTGGILTCFYLTPNIKKGANEPTARYTAAQALSFYAQKGYHIFNQSKHHSLWGLRQLVDATQYSAKNLEAIFEEEFGNLKMNELLKPCIITTYNMVKKNTFFFSSIEPKNLNREFYVKDVARSTSAAPTYFPPAKIRNLITNELMINIDGGVFANNPTMCAYAECRNTIFPQASYPSAKDMLILSIGTGGGQFELTNINNSNKWGVINWAKSIPDIMMDGSIDTVDYEMKNLFGSLEKEHQLNYKRIDVPIDKRKYASDMADASPTNINALKTAAKETLDNALKEQENAYGLDKFIDLLCDNAPDSKISQ